MKNDTNQSFTEVQIAAIKALKRRAPEGCLIYTKVHHVYSGMKRTMSFFSIVDGKEELLDGWLADLFGLKGERKGEGEGLVVEGAGMNMGLYISSQLARTLYGRENAFQYEDRDELLMS